MRILLLLRSKKKLKSIVFIRNHFYILSNGKIKQKMYVRKNK